jgi:hypothetical protein
MAGNTGSGLPNVIDRGRGIRLVSGAANWLVYKAFPDVPGMSRYSGSRGKRPNGEVQASGFDHYQN